MADAPAPKHKEKGKILGMSYLTVGLSAAGLLVAYYLYRRMQASNAASAAQQSTGLAGGNTVPSGQTSGGTSSLPSFSSFSQWEQAALSGMTKPGYTASQALNDLVAWVSGQCVSSAGYTAIGNAVTTQGLPPGFGTSLPPLTVCKSASTSTSGTNAYAAVPSHAANLADQAAGIAQYQWDAATGSFVPDSNPSAYNGVTYIKKAAAALFNIVPSHAANLADQAAGITQYQLDPATGKYVVDSNPSAYNGVTYTKRVKPSGGSGTSAGGG